MNYEVLISTTVATVLLPLDFWSAAEIVLWVALASVFWKLRDAVFGGHEHYDASLQRADH
jgi:hypothetical protein